MTELNNPNIEDVTTKHWFVNAFFVFYVTIMTILSFAALDVYGRTNIEYGKMQTILKK